MCLHFLLPIFPVHGWCSITTDNATSLKSDFLPLSQRMLYSYLVEGVDNKQGKQAFIHLNAVFLTSHLDVLVEFQFRIKIQHTALLSNIL